MHSIFNSAFLQALGYAIANSLWQMALLWIIFWLLNILVKPGAANKYRIAVASQITGFAWFVFTLQFYFIKCSDALQTNSALHQTANVTYIVPDNGNSFFAVLLKTIIQAEQLLPFLSFAYLLLLLFLFARWIINYNRTQAIRSKGLMDIDETWEAFITKAAAQLGITKNIGVYVSTLINSPLTVGFIKPIILIPIASINHLSTQQLEAVLLHELAHIKRSDYLLNLFLSVTEIVLFFNPFTQSISRHIKRERENSCDDWVLQFQYNPAMYAEALLQIASLSNEKHVALSMNATQKNGELLPRIKRMIGSKDNRFSYSHQLLSLLFITAILSSIAWFHPIVNYQKNSIATPSKTKQVIVEPMAAKVDNPLYNPVFFLKKPLQHEIKKSMKIAAESIAASASAMKQADEAITTAMPVAMKKVENVDFDKIGKDVERSLKSINFKQLKNSNIPLLDTLALKNEMKLVFDEKLGKQFEKMAADLKKASVEFDKAMHDKLTHKKAMELNELKLQEELNKAMLPLSNIEFPFIGKLPPFLNKIKSDHLKRRIDSITNKEINIRKKRIENIQEIQIDVDDENTDGKTSTQTIIVQTYN